MNINQSSSGVIGKVFPAGYRSFGSRDCNQLRELEKDLSDRLKLSTITPVEKMKISNRLTNIRNIINLIQGI